MWLRVPATRVVCWRFRTTICCCCAAAPWHPQIIRYQPPQHPGILP
jgi:hypothetical protein